MTWGAVAIGGATLVGGMMSSKAQSSAASSASDAQTASSQAGIAEQQRQFDAVQNLLSPYVNAGYTAINSQQDLAGLNGADAQRNSIDGIKGGVQFKSMQQQGENSILANASATGGLRGGNTQGALAQFSPALLSQLIDSQYSKLGGLTSLGQNAAVGVGNAGMQTGNAISNLYGQMEARRRVTHWRKAGQTQPCGMRPASRLQGLTLDLAEGKPRNNWSEILMPHPNDYTLNVPDPTQSFMQSFQNGMGVQEKTR